jgi:hypothetical protein
MSSYDRQSLSAVLQQIKVTLHKVRTLNGKGSKVKVKSGGKAKVRGTH